MSFQSSKPLPPDENRLVAGALRNEEDSIRAITRQNNRRLFRMARSIIKDDSEAEDIVQECYVRAFTRLREFRGRSRLSTWLTRIVINEALGRLRHRRKAVELGISEATRLPATQILHFPVSAQLDPERTMAQRQIIEILERSIDALPEAFRVVLIARLVEGMSVEETAEVLVLQPQTVKTRLHRARKQLYDDLERQVGKTLTNVFPFAGVRCERMTNAIIWRLRTI